jgi:hypothetical protein
LFVKIRLPLAVLTALAAAAMYLAATVNPANAIVTRHFLLFNVGLQKCAVQNGNLDQLYLATCPDASRTDINHSALWIQNTYGQIVNMHSDFCMIVTGATPRSGVWLTGPTAPGSGKCTNVTVDEWTFGSEGADFQFANNHSHLYMTGLSTGGLTQNTQGNANQYWAEIPTNSAN